MGTATTFACGTAAACVRAIDLNYPCRVTNDRMRMTGKQAPEAVFQAPGAQHPRQDCAGPSLLEQMWATLIEEMDALMPGGEYADEPAHVAEGRYDGTGGSEWHEERARLRGVCQGVTACIALVINPYAPNLDAVRADAVTRWEKANAEG